jgi:hypothetical protein
MEGGRLGLVLSQIFRSEESSRVVIVFYYVLSHIHLVISLAQEIGRRGPVTV